MCFLGEEEKMIFFWRGREGGCFSWVKGVFFFGGEKGFFWVEEKVGEGRCFFWRRRGRERFFWVERFFLGGEGFFLRG